MLNRWLNKNLLIKLRKMRILNNHNNNNLSQSRTSEQLLTFKNTKRYLRNKFKNNPLKRSKRLKSQLNPNE